MLTKLNILAFNRTKDEDWRSEGSGVPFQALNCMQQIAKLALLVVALAIAGCATNGYQKVSNGDTPISCNSPEGDSNCGGDEDADDPYRVRVQLPGKTPAPPSPSPSNSDIPNFPAGSPR